jgi:hypothetical protein
MRDDEMYNIDENDDLKKSRLLTVERYDRSDGRRMTLKAVKEVLQIVALALIVVIEVTIVILANR